MSRFRRLLLDHRMLSACVIALALLIKVLVPAGFMPVVSGGAVTIQICTGIAPAKMAMPGMRHHGDASDHDGSGHDDSGHEGKEMPCAFSGLSAPSLAAVDPLLLAIAITFIVATIVRRVVPEVARPRAFLRPPLRAPPTTP